jgi:hypothetical protein
VLASCFSWLAAPSTADWLQQRHDAAHTGYTRDSVTPPLELKWTHEPPGRTCGYLDGDSLFAAEDSLFLNAPNAEFSRLHARTGEVIWRMADREWVVGVAGEVIVEASVVTRRHPVGRQVVVGDTDLAARGTLLNRINAYETSTGALRWSATTDNVLCDPAIARGFGCAVRERSVCVSDIRPAARHRREPSLVWLDAETGVLTGETQLVPPWLGLVPPPEEWTQSPYLLPFDIRAWGRNLMMLMHWEGATRGRRRPGPWAISGDAIVGVTPEEAAYTLHVATGLQVLSSETPRVALAERAGVSLQYEGRNNSAEALTCRHLRSGELIWSRPLVTAGSRYTPAVDEDTAYVGTYDGTVYALDLFSGETVWRAVVGKPFPEENIRVPDEKDARGITYDAPVCSVAGDTVWVLYARRILALDAASGEIEWMKPGIVLEGYEPVLHAGWLYLLTPMGIEAWGPPPYADEEKADYREAQPRETTSEPE